MTHALLGGLRVLDLGIMVAGPYCAKLLGDAGADVIHVERPSGDPSRHLGPFGPADAAHRFSATYAFLNANKRSVVVDFASAEGRDQLWRLVAWADIVVENFKPGTLDRHGFSTQALLKARPDLVQVSISNYGQSGPYRDYAATELTLQAMSGMMDGNGELEREPLRYPGQTVQMMAGANGAYAALVARRHAARTGQGQQVDVSIQESMATTFYMLCADYQYSGALQARGQRDLYPTADGLLMARWLSSRSWDEFALAFDALELTHDPELQPALAYGPNAAKLAGVLSDHLRTRSRREWFARAVEYGIPAGMLQSLDEVMDCPHLAARDFWDETYTASGRRVRYPGTFYTLGGDRGSRERVVPDLGEHTGDLHHLPPRTTPATVVTSPPAKAAPPGPALTGLRIIDNGIVQAGTFPSRLLADFGAQVVRVENYLRPDMSRNAAYPAAGPGERYWEEGGTYHEQHRNKDFCVGLDVSRPEGRELFLQLCMISDVVVDSHPPGVLERLGLGYDTLREVRPDIILITTSGYGRGGPYSAIRSFGMMTELMCGLSANNGYPGEARRRGTIPYTDHETVYHIAALLLAALERRERTGEGAWLDVSQYEVGINMLGDEYVARSLGAERVQLGNTDPGMLFSGCFRCVGEDAWITLSAGRAGLNVLAKLLDQPELVTSTSQFEDSVLVDGAALSAEAATASAGGLAPAGRGALEHALSEWAAQRTAQQCLEALQSAGIAAGLVADMRDLLLDPHLAARGFYWLVNHHPNQGAGRRAWPGVSAQLSATPGRLRHRAPLLGEHNQTVLCGMLGHDATAYDALTAKGAAGTVPLAAATRPAARPPAARLVAGPWSAGKIKLHDPEVVARLRERFGPTYAEESDG